MRETVPGLTLSLITEEYDLMESIKGVLVDKLRLDEKYTEDLCRIRDSIQPKCKEGMISSLFSPLIKLFEDEIANRKSACKAISDRLVSLPNPSPNKPDEAGISPSSLYEPLRTRYLEAMKQHQSASKRDSISEMRRWYNKSTSTMSYEWSHLNFRLPRIDREYRESISHQSEVVSSSLSWHTSSLPERLEQHHHNSEFLKNIIRDVIDENIRLYSNVVRRCSAAVQSLDKFSGASLLAPMHEAAIEEQSHPFLQPVPYHNFWLDGKQSPQPIFATTRAKLDEVVTLVLDQVGNAPLYFYRDNSVIDTALGIERQCQYGQNLRDIIGKLGHFELWGVLTFALMNHPSLLQLDDRAIERYQFTLIPYASIAPTSMNTKRHNYDRVAAVPRNKIPSILPRDETALKILRRLFNCKISVEELTTLITHRTDARPLVQTISSKWDFNRNAPLPKRNNYFAVQVGLPARRHTL